MSLLTWWIDHRTPGSPEQMDELYHRLVWGGVACDEGANGQVCAQ